MIFYYPYLGYKEKCEKVPITFPPQHQPVQPGLETLMFLKPIFDNPDYIGSGKLKNKIALITGGDSGIGRAVSLAFAKEGANIAIVYFNEHVDALKTKSLIESQGKKCILIAGDLRQKSFCKKIIKKIICTIGVIL